MSTTADERGRLCVGGVPATEIAAEFGTPTHLLDEEDFRARIRGYRAALPDVELVYAGMALLSTAVAGWAAAEGAGVAVCSAGELATALAGGVPPSRIILHGNAKTAGELHDAATAGVGRVVIDSPSEITLLAARLRRRQRVLVRVIPDVGAQAATGSSASLWPAARRPARSSACWISHVWSWSDCIASSGRKSPTRGSMARQSDKWSP